MKTFYNLNDLLIIEKWIKTLTRSETSHCSLGPIMKEILYKETLLGIKSGFCEKI